MTNEQLAILLTTYRSQLLDIFNQLRTELKDIEGLEYYPKRGKWIGDGEGPDLWKSSKNEDWECLNGNPICLDGLGKFIVGLEENSKVLKE